METLTPAGRPNYFFCLATRAKYSVYLSLTWCAHNTANSHNYKPFHYRQTNKDLYMNK